MKKILILIMFLLSLGGVFGININDNDIIAYYPLANNSYEESGNWINGTDSGVTYNGTSALFDAGDKITLGDLKSNDNTYSWALKIKPDTINSVYPLTKYRSPNDYPYIIFLLSSSNRYSCGIRGSGTSHFATSTTNIALEEKSIVCVRNSTTLKIYIDGVEEGSTTLPGTVYTTISNTQLGDDTFGNSNEFSGSIKQFLFIDRALNTSDIESYNISGVVDINLKYKHITINNETIINNSFFNTTELDFTTDVLNKSTNGNVNQTYYLYQNNSLINSSQFATNNLNGSFNLNLADNEYNIYFYAQNNITNVTSNNFTFTIDTTPPTINNSIPNEINTYDIDNLSSLFNCENSNTCIINFTTTSQVFNQTQTNITLNQNGNISYTITAEDLAGNTATDNGTLFVNPEFYLSFKDTNNNSINNYNLGGIDYSNFTTGKYYNNGFVIGNNTLEFEALGYAITNISFVLNSTPPALNETFTIQKSKIVLKVYDVTTGNLITSNIDYTLIPTNSSGSFTGGKINISNIAFDSTNYQIILENADYETESLFFTYTNKEVLNLNAYMIATNTTNLGLLNVKVEDSIDVISGQLVNLLVWSSSQSSFITVGQSTTNSNGDAFFNVELGNKVYKVTSTRNGETVTSPEQIIDLSGTIIYVFFGDSLEEYPTETYKDITYSLTNTSFNSTHDLITFSFSDANNLVTQACLEVNRLKGSKSTTISENCVSSASGEIQIYTSINNTFTKEVLARAYIGDTTRKLDNIIYESSLTLEGGLGNLSQWVVLIMILAVIALGVYLENIAFLGVGVIVISWVTYSIFSSTLSYTIPLLITIIMVLVLYGTFKKRF